jgi:hypothetical protein
LINTFLPGNAKQRLLPLESGRLIAAAVRRSGMKHAGPRLEEALKVLTALCDSEAELSLFGRIAVRQHFTDLLSTRFRLVDYWKRTPEIQAQQLSPQIFITGLQKSASTFLHRLLEFDANNRAPRMWEVMYPLPFSAGGSNGRDPRIVKTENRLQWLRWLHPKLVQAHPIGALMPQECGEILSYSLESDIFSDMFHIPSYVEWLRERDPEPAYRFHELFLKHLQWRRPAGRWILKSSDHVQNLKTLLNVYPGARIIFLHRDPVKVLQASSSQQVLLKKLFSNRLDPAGLALEEEGSLYDKTRKIMEFRDRHAGQDDRFMDVRYQDLAADPVGTVRKIYERFGLSLSDEDEARMVAFADSERERDRSDRFDLEDFGVSPEEGYRRFADYSERFAVEREALQPRGR